MDISHGIRQLETPTRTPQEGRWCSSPGCSHRGPWDTRYGHARGCTLKHHSNIWNVSGFWGHIVFFTALYALSQSVISAGIFFLPQKTTNKTNHSIFSSQLQAAACLLLGTRAVQSDSYIFLCVDTPFFSIIKRKMNWKHIQRYKSPQSLRSVMGEEPCWEIPCEAWCCLCFPQAWYIDGETGREAPAAFLFIFVLAAESVGSVPSWCQRCAGVTTDGLLAGLFDLSSCRGGNGTWIFSFFFLLKAVLAAMSSVASTVNPHAHRAAPLL